jgi:hypothetical protein
MTQRVAIINPVCHKYHEFEEAKESAGKYPLILERLCKWKNADLRTSVICFLNNKAVSKIIPKFLVGSTGEMVQSGPSSRGVS